MENTVAQPLSYADKVADMRRGADWFFWIAALAVINSAVVTFGGTDNLIFSLGATQAVDAALRPNLLAPVDQFGFAINVVIAAVFALFGFLARRGSDKAFIIGMFLYAIDAMITIGFRDMFAFGFHMVALFFLFKGMLASRKRFDPSV